MKDQIIKDLISLFVLLAAFVVTFICSAALSGIVCWCFGLTWSLKVALGVAVVWFALIGTVFVILFATEGEEDE